jgi:hypothetical protein
LHPALYDRVLNANEFGKSRLDHICPLFPAAIYLGAKYRARSSWDFEGQDAVPSGKSLPGTGRGPMRK